MDKCSSSQASEVTLDGMLRTRELLKQQLKLSLKNNKYVQLTSTKIIDYVTVVVFI